MRVRAARVYSKYSDLFVLDDVIFGPLVLMHISLECRRIASDRLRQICLQDNFKSQSATLNLLFNYLVPLQLLNKIKEVGCSQEISLLGQRHQR